MTTHIRLRTVDNDVRELAIRDGSFAEPGPDLPEEVVDATRWVALPGLADCHAHLTASSIDELVRLPAQADLAVMAQNGRRKLEGGVLLAADKGFKSDDSLRYLDVPKQDRPDLEMAGGIIATPGGYYEGFAVEPTDAELANEVARAATTRASWVKLIGDWPRPGEGPVPNFSDEALESAVAVAHAAGKRVAIHTMAPGAPSQAVRAGIDSIEHGLFLTDDDVRSLGGRGGAWVPTIAAVEMLVQMLGPDSSGGRLLQEGLGRVKDLLPEAASRGVVVLAGTDLSVPHGRVSVEAERMVAYGMEPEAAVHAITAAAHQYLGRPAPLASGASADVVCFRDDPREDINVLQDPDFVMRRGRVIRGA
jgi:imidazolonepropionase-like amidohydrolase